MHEFKKISGNHKNARAGICLTGSFSKEKNKNIIRDTKIAPGDNSRSNFVYTLKQSKYFALLFINHLKNLCSYEPTSEIQQISLFLRLRWQ